MVDRSWGKMKLFIDINNITDAPIENSDMFKDTISTDLVNELLFSKPTTYLVSGYRGVGKTSYIKALKKQLKNKSSNILYVHINVGKYSNFPAFLRTLIRELYWEISKDNRKVEIRKTNPRLISDIDLIFDRTFNNVDIKQNNKHLTEKEINRSLNIDLTQFITRFLISGIGITAILSYLRDGNMYIYLLLLIICGLLIIKYEKKKSDKNSNLIEINRANIYDDEIAEHQLNKIINELNGAGYKITFVVDELDKIEKDDEINNLIGELKPIMLSGSANFILISGQRLYYKYQLADKIDDDILSSLFSRIVHVPLVSVEMLINYFDKLFIDISYKENYLVKSYLKSKILLSHRVLRKFINIIRQDMKVEEDGSCYLNILESKKDIYATDAKLIEILEGVEKETINKSNYEEGIKDLLISQLYIAIKSMKSLKPLDFQLSDIVNSEDLKQPDYTYQYFKQISNCTNVLLENMVKENLLDKVVIDEDAETYKYKWKEEVVIEKSLDELDYMVEFIFIEGLIRDIVAGLIQTNYISHFKSFSEKAMLPLNECIKILKDNKVLRNSILEDLKPLQYTRNKIAHGANDFEKNSIFLSKSQMRKIKYGILDDFFEFLLQKVNPDFNIIKEYDGYDLSIEDTVIEVKLFKNHLSFIDNLPMIEDRFISHNTKYKQMIVIGLYQNATDEKLKKAERMLNQINISNNIKVVIINRIEVEVLSSLLKKDIKSVFV